MPAIRSMNATIAATSRSPRPCCWAAVSDRVGAPRDRHRHAEPLALGQHEHHVLAHQREPEGGVVERAPADEVAAEVHDRRAVAAAGDHLQHVLAAQPGALAEDDRLRQRRHLHPHQHVEDELHRRAHPVGAEEGHAPCRSPAGCPPRRGSPRPARRPSPAARRCGRASARRRRRRRAPGGRWRGARLGQLAREVGRDRAHVDDVGSPRAGRRRRRPRRTAPPRRRPGSPG